MPSGSGKARAGNLQRPLSDGCTRGRVSLPPRRGRIRQVVLGVLHPVAHNFGGEQPKPGRLAGLADGDELGVGVVPEPLEVLAAVPLFEAEVAVLDPRLEPAERRRKPYRGDCACEGSAESTGGRFHSPPLRGMTSSPIMRNSRIRGCDRRNRSRSRSPRSSRQIEGPSFHSSGGGPWRRLYMPGEVPIPEKSPIHTRPSFFEPEAWRELKTFRTTEISENDVSELRGDEEVLRLDVPVIPSREPAAKMSLGPRQRGERTFHLGTYVTLQLLFEFCSHKLPKVSEAHVLGNASEMHKDGDVKAHHDEVHVVPILPGSMHLRKERDTVLRRVGHDLQLLAKLKTIVVAKVVPLVRNLHRDHPVEILAGGEDSSAAALGKRSEDGIPVRGLNQEVVAVVAVAVVRLATTCLSIQRRVAGKRALTRGWGQRKRFGSETGGWQPRRLGSEVQRRKRWKRWHLLSCRDTQRTCYLTAGARAISQNARFGDVDGNRSIRGRIEPKPKPLLVGEGAVGSIKGVKECISTYMSTLGASEEPDKGDPLRQDEETFFQNGIPIAIRADERRAVKRRCRTEDKWLKYRSPGSDSTAMLRNTTKSVMNVTILCDVLLEQTKRSYHRKISALQRVLTLLVSVCRMQHKCGWRVDAKRQGLGTQARHL
ncbi:uncharacterized protein BXZ73DRAFT_79433 [Epithele typhae]|uniref:uncharacterized protein n=1 Tax=Epithele typhae TaxID=378194 RepID=UPI002007E10A|nr:uncharacterized protein BXZ73DRAFT_79433 [Epithele typhae]KAH9923746.1 hypothetical protein BXZ73DRAFT_79433 [Epithele typhae]